MQVERRSTPPRSKRQSASKKRGPTVPASRCEAKAKVKEVEKAASHKTVRASWEQAVELIEQLKLGAYSKDAFALADLAGQQSKSGRWTKVECEGWRVLAAAATKLGKELSKPDDASEEWQLASGELLTSWNRLALARHHREPIFQMEFLSGVCKLLLDPSAPVLLSNIAFGLIHLTNDLLDESKGAEKDNPRELWLEIHTAAVDLLSVTTGDKPEDSEFARERLYNALASLWKVLRDNPPRMAPCMRERLTDYLRLARTLHKIQAGGPLKVNDDSWQLLNKTALTEMFAQGWTEGERLVWLAMASSMGQCKPRDAKRQDQCCSKSTYLSWADRRDSEWQQNLEAKEELRRDRLAVTTRLPLSQSTPGSESAPKSPPLSPRALEWRKNMLKEKREDREAMGPGHTPGSGARRTLKDMIRLLDRKVPPKDGVHLQLHDEFPFLGASSDEYGTSKLHGASAGQLRNLAVFARRQARDRDNVGWSSDEIASWKEMRHTATWAADKKEGAPEVFDTLRQQFAGLYDGGNIEVAQLSHLSALAIAEARLCAQTGWMDDAQLWSNFATAVDDADQQTNEMPEERREALNNAWEAVKALDRRQ